jgi:hypothetical protein
VAVTHLSKVTGSSVGEPGWNMGNLTSELRALTTVLLALPQEG